MYHDALRRSQRTGGEPVGFHLCRNRPWYFQNFRRFGWANGVCGFDGAFQIFYGKLGHRINLDRFMIASSILCIFSYLGISLLRLPQLSLIACALCGLSVGIMWPGTFSKASSALPKGGTAMFALLALAGDLGCSGGSTLVGMVSDQMGNSLKLGILAGVIFPILLLIGVFLCRKAVKART